MPKASNDNETIDTPDFAPAENIGQLMDNLTNSTTGDDIDLSSFDLSKVKDNELSVLTHGETYDFYITKITSGKSANNNGTWRILLTVTEDYAEAGSSILDSITLTEAAIWKFKSLCKVTGLLSDDGKTFIGNGKDDFIGHVIRGKIKNESWEGQMRSKINGGYIPVDSLNPSNVESTSVVPSFG